MIFIPGCKKTATNTVLSSVTLEIKPTSRALPRKYGIIGMLALRPPQRCMKKGCASEYGQQQVLGANFAYDTFVSTEAPFKDFLKNGTPHSRYFSDELGVPIFL